MALSNKKQLENIKEKLHLIEYCLPGKVSKQYNVCGTIGCKCKDKKNPKKHGPYHYLSFSLNGKSKTIFIPKDSVSEIKRRNKEYLKLKKFLGQLLEINIEIAKNEVLHGKR